jgi:hypothetical protein
MAQMTQSMKDIANPTGIRKRMSASLACVMVAPSGAFGRAGKARQKERQAAVYRRNDRL